MSEVIIARHLVVRGKVQGVGFRETMRREAERLNVLGWVRNRHDGSVEATVQGATDAVEAMLEWAHDGPASAKVLHLEVKEVTQQSFTRFSVWPTG